jgi:hypothetical protein
VRSHAVRSRMMAIQVACPKNATPARGAITIESGANADNRRTKFFPRLTRGSTSSMIHATSHQRLDIGPPGGSEFKQSVSAVPGAYTQIA